MFSTLLEGSKFLININTYNDRVCGREIDSDLRCPLLQFYSMLLYRRLCEIGKTGASDEHHENKIMYQRNFLSAEKIIAHRHAIHEQRHVLPILCSIHFLLAEHCK